MMNKTKRKRYEMEVLVSCQFAKSIRVLAADEEEAHKLAMEFAQKHIDELVIQPEGWNVEVDINTEEV